MEEDMTKFHEPPVARLSPTEGAAKMDALNAKLTRSALLSPHSPPLPVKQVLNAP